MGAAWADPLRTAPNIAQARSNACSSWVRRVAATQSGHPTAEVDSREAVPCGRGCSRGTSAAGRCMNSSGLMTRCVELSADTRAPVDCLVPGEGPGHWPGAACKAVAPRRLEFELHLARILELHVFVRRRRPGDVTAQLFKPACGRLPPPAPRRAMSAHGGWRAVASRGIAPLRVRAFCRVRASKILR